MIDLPNLFDAAVFGLASVQPTTLSMVNRTGPAVSPSSFPMTAHDIVSYYAQFKPVSNAP